MRKLVALYIGSRYASLRSRNFLVGFISLLTVGGLALGVAILVTVLSVMNGFDREMQQRILGLVPHITVTTPRLNYLRSEAEWKDTRAIIDNTPGVLATAPYMQLQGMLLANGHSKGVLLNGVDPAQEARVSIINNFMQSGSLDALQDKSYHIAIGANLARQLGVKAGDAVTLVSTVVPLTPMGEFTRQKTFTVAAIFSVGSQLDSNLALVNLGDAQRVYRLTNQLHGYRIRSDNLFGVAELTTRLRAAVTMELNYDDWTRSYGNIYENIRMSKALVGLLLSLLVAVAAFNVIVSLMMVVREKQGDIAILRTMGTATGTIRNIFLVQGLAIGLIGTASGVVIGVLLSLSIGDIVAALQTMTGVQFLSADIYPVNYLPSQVQLGDVLLVGALALVLSLLATLYPAARAARTRPAEILRYE
ncbi:MAG: lipoprotein-releasing ABC transporter permease subunit [Gammaproteobacteria bacterium]